MGRGLGWVTPRGPCQPPPCWDSVARDRLGDRAGRPTTVTPPCANSQPLHGARVALRKAFGSLQTHSDLQKDPVTAAARDPPAQSQHIQPLPLTPGHHEGLAAAQSRNPHSIRRINMSAHNLSPTPSSGSCCRASQLQPWLQHLPRRTVSSEEMLATTLPPGRASGRSATRCRASWGNTVIFGSIHPSLTLKEGHFRPPLLLLS